MELDPREKASNSAISDYIKRQIMSKVTYINESKAKHAQEEIGNLSLKTETKLFWGDCIESFQEQISILFEEFERRPMSRWPAPNKVFFCDYMDNFEAAYNEARAVCIAEKCRAIDEKYNELREAFGLAEKDIIRLDKTYEQLMKQLSEDRKTEASWEILVFGEVNFEYLKYLLDLTSKEIRKLLPYLLTAYTCNFRKSKYFFGKKSSLKIITSDNQELDAIEAHKRIYMLKNIANIFSLSQYEAKTLPSQSQKEDNDLTQNQEEDIEPMPWSWSSALEELCNQNNQLPLIRYSKLIRQVFLLWVNAIQETASTAKIEDFPEDVDVETCQALIDLYCPADDKPGE